MSPRKAQPWGHEYWKRRTQVDVSSSRPVHICVCSTVMRGWWKWRPPDNSGTIPGCSSVVWEQALANGSVPLFPVCIFSSCCLTVSEWLGWAQGEQCSAWIMQSCQSKLLSVVAATLKLRTGCVCVGGGDGGEGFCISSGYVHLVS